MAQILSERPLKESDYKRVRACAEVFEGAGVNLQEAPSSLLGRV